MSLRRSLSLPIILASVMITLLVVLTVGWIVLALVGALKDSSYAGLYWTLLPLGTTFIVLLVVGVIVYLVLSIKAINLNQRQSNFIDSVTHELKSPIASLKLCVQTLHRRQVSHEEQAGFYRFMVEDLERLDHLINQLLDAGRLDSDRVESEVEDVSLGPLLRECAETVCFRYHVPADAVRLELQDCVVRARRIDLDVAFRNLIDNAVKYAGAPPEVNVALRPSANGRVIAQISDNGRGIPYKLRRKIFGRFVRLGRELERDKPGTGLGLYIARTAVQRLRGTIRVRDNPSGRGTVFEVQLPGQRS